METFVLKVTAGDVTHRLVVDTKSYQKFERDLSVGKSEWISVVSLDDERTAWFRGDKVSAFETQPIKNKISRKAGVSIREISQVCGSPYSTLFRKVKELGLEKADLPDGRRLATSDGNFDALELSKADRQKLRALEQKRTGS